MCCQRFCRSKKVCSDSESKCNSVKCNDGNVIMLTNDSINLNINELVAVRDALQLLSKKEQKLMESSGKVSLNGLYNKFVSKIEEMERRF